MSNGLVGDWSYLGFSSEMHTPISVFMENGNIINIYDKRVSSNGLHPAFLFSFEGKCCIVVATKRANDSQNHVQHCWFITSFVGESSISSDLEVMYVSGRCVCGQECM